MCQIYPEAHKRFRGYRHSSVMRARYFLVQALSNFHTPYQCLQFLSILVAFCPRFQGWSSPTDKEFSMNHSFSSSVGSSSKSFHAHSWRSYIMVKYQFGMCRIFGQQRTKHIPDKWQWPRVRFCASGKYCSLTQILLTVHVYMHIY